MAYRKAILAEAQQEYRDIVGYLVGVLQSKQAARNFMEEFDKQAPDMVLLDIMLPVMDGWAVCAYIREKAKTPIIMLTAKSEVNDRITGLEMGADDYLVKPFEMKELMARINAVLRRNAQVRSELLPREDGGVTLRLILDDDKGNLMTLDLLAVSEDQANQLADQFRLHPETLYENILQTLLGEPPL